MANENESSTDIQDVRSECPPEVDRSTASPLRESHSQALPSLPSQTYDLAAPHVPMIKVVSLVNLLYVAQ